MSTDLEFVTALADEVLDIVAPLEQAVTSLDGFSALLSSHGWVPPTGQDYIDAVQAAVGSLIDVTAIRDAFSAFLAQPGLDSASKVLDAVGRALASLRVPTVAELDSALPPPLNDIEFWKVFLREVGDGLFIDWLRRRQPKVFALAHLVGVVELAKVEPSGAYRLPYLQRRVAWESIADLLNPVEAMKRAYGWGTASFNATLFLERLTAALVALGVQAAREPAAAALAVDFWDPVAPADRLDAVVVPLYREGSVDDDNRIDLSLELLPVPAKPKPAASPAPWVGLALVPTFAASAMLTVPLSADFRLELDAAVQGLAGPALELRPGAGPELRFSGAPPAADLAARVTGTPEVPFLLLGSRGSHRVELAGFTFGVELIDPFGASAELKIGGALQGLVVTIQLKDGDGFLNKIFGTQPQTLTADTRIIWSSRTGLAFEGQAALKLILPVNRQLGPVDVQQLILALSVSSDATIRISGAITAKALLGPVSGSVEEAGVALTLRPDDKAPAIGGLGLSWGFLPPKGLSLRIAGGPVTGGGYLFCDPDAGEYAGALELSFKAISLKAIGLLNTKLPDGRPGFSLLIIITVEFTPIQLGFGFTLNGVGGLLGINRTMSTDALRAGVKQRTLDAILFPKNPAANAPQLIAALKPVFPPAESRYTFGPMVKIGWGPSSLLEIEAALILELPSPLRLAVLGRISAILPDKKAAIVSLRLDVAGIVDFDRGEISVDASLVDSSLAMFALTGDMALRAGWKADKTFALSAGGFNPRFAPPPSFPTLERLAISLANSDNPRLRLESYFALTANTVQFGARIDFYAKADTFVGTFSAAAFAGFDAMVQFQPFGFVADFCMGIELAHNGEPFLAASLYATISGPRPWHVTGVVEFVFLGKHQISVDVMIGEAGQPPAAQVTLTPEIVRALEAADAWTAELPDVAGQLVTLRSGTPDLVDLVHPLGSMTVRQRLLPLELAVARFGQAVPAPGTANRFAISATALIAGGTTISRHEGAALAATHDDFAPGQFLDLTDDQKLAGPAFQSMPSGVRVATATRRWPTAGADAAPAGVDADLGYDTDVMDAPPSALQLIAAPGGAGPAAGGTSPAELEEWLLARLVPGGAAANSAQRVDVNRYAGPDQRVAVAPERYTVAARATLQPRAGDASSFAQAVQRVTDSHAEQVVTVAELAR